MKNANGSGTPPNGQDNEGEDPKIARFPTPAERREIERMKAAMEAAKDVAREAREKQGGGKSEPILNMPPVVKWLCGTLILIHLALEFGPPEWRGLAVEHLAFIPARYTGGLEMGYGGWLGPFTHVLLHGGWLHLAMNIGMLMAFGSGLEKSIGSKKMLLLFVATSLLGVLTHFCIVPRDATALIGASGGISGLFGAILVMAQEQGQMGKGGMRGLIPFVLVWIGISLFFGMFGMPGETSAIAWTVHIGGFIAGLGLYKPIAKLKI